MKKRVFNIMGLSFLLAAFALATVPAQAQNMDDKIKVLEQELMQLKSEQIELRKDATAAAAALPDISYRPGAGLGITAPDQSWAFKFGWEYAIDIMKLEGNDARREGDFGIFGRRNRPQWVFSVENGLYELASELDIDGDETGGKNTIIQRACLRVRMEKLNPWLPTFQFGMDCSGAGSRYRSSEMTFELPTQDRNNGFNTGSHTGYGWNWGNLPAFGLPGNQQFNYYLLIHGMGLGDGVRDESNKADHLLMWNINPFSRDKNKWISGIGFSMMAWISNIDNRPTTNNAAGFSTNTFQLRSQEGSRRLVFWNSPAGQPGDHHFLSPSAQYKVGPYQLNFVAGFDRYSDGDSTGPHTAGMRGTGWKLMNDVMIWSPKGFFTGAPGQKGTLGFGYAFEKTWADCGATACENSAIVNPPGPDTGANAVRRTVLTVNEWGLRYWLAPAVSVHLAIKHYNASNAPRATRIAANCDNNQTTTSQDGRSCSFTDAVIRFYMVY
jgi:hypothetical protein